MKLSSPIYKLKRRARMLARADGIRLHEALNRIAAGEGFESWSHMAAGYADATPARRILRSISAGEMVLIAARPGHGKTLLGLELAVLAGEIGRQGYFFSLEYTKSDVQRRLAALGAANLSDTGALIVDTSDDICAEHVTKIIEQRDCAALAVIDYLQLLDQRRSHPPLEAQVRDLRAFARAKGAVVCLISQVDRSFDLTERDWPAVDDVRLPNPLDLSLFDRLCFLHDGNIRMERAG
ncbi:DNA helicase [Algicella marina]|uniref:AAA family ATPase n=1 Tax=Algicella marina TaxID=2683284 RepID=A0A6P1SZM2_9RHOB|nr:DNA helicase [Algicella marina]QHQ35197.1 AAA family ATPase [Algicella marina]